MRGRPVNSLKCKCSFTEKSLLHANVSISVYFPSTTGDEFGTIYFVGGYNTLVLAEFYSVYLRKVASHGFYVFGIDYDYPLYQDRIDGTSSKPHEYDQDVDTYFKELEFVCLPILY